MTENERLTLKSVNGDVWLLDSEGKPYLLSVDGDDYNNALNRLADFETIGTIEEFKALKEKNEPKKPITYTHTHRADCPNCRATVRGIDKPFGDYCSKCGIKLDWSE